jgi:DNA-binding transcriptional ArsR family regulator
MAVSTETFKRLLWWLIAGTRGGRSRGKIINVLKERPSNASQLADTLKMDYKTIRHHLDVLLENKLIVKMGEKYAASYFLSPQLDLQYDVFQEIWLKIEKEEKNRK